MNTNPNAITVLCYGDSNTWGQKPDKTGRYDADVRWTGVLQDLLGSEYYIIEEGLGSRTTDLEYDRKPGRNGKTYLVPCVASHSPVDIIAIMLGTNDLKTEYSRNASDIADAIEGLVGDVRTYGLNKAGKSPAIILISPILINPVAPRFAEFYTDYYDEKSAQASLDLARVIQEVAEASDCLFISAAEVAQPGEDGIHLDKASNGRLAEAVAAKIKELRSK